ncbi:retrovirus-related Pol polyprotein from transposon 412 [Trichonephila inaurata madagascariensis]|uniref:Retrovirus-related Pol polyprotein from transposon 412 n=1 Tax=Trichonephila inaurata madagascariensis TaxID=2747483 RepID=A0A8X6WP13_9ARAC|nr:retrovirus-related Pol polyprotein from transposon 412 [Trichonephila inaurata madagascariensis]
MPIKIKRRSCYFCGETQGVNAASLTPDDPTLRSTYNFREQKDLATCSHVFLRTDSLRKGLQPPYEGPYKVVNGTEKVFRILRHEKEVSVSIDRLKPDYPKEPGGLPSEVNLKEKSVSSTRGNTRVGTRKPRESSSRQEITTRSGRRVPPLTPI